MKKYLLLSLVCLATLILISWGFIGHRTVALIAERHLSLQAKTAVADLLDGQSLADVSTWADEVRNKPGYKFRTTNWHFLNLPVGLNRDQFDKQVKSQDKENVYTALLKEQQVLQSASSTREEKIEALKFIIHLVGDAHQPMHISREEDKGGNTIQVQFEGKGTNLHSLWDSKLLDKQGLTDQQLVDKLDNKGKYQENILAKSEPMQWIWESYQIGSKLYDEVKSGSKLGDDYYQKHIGTVDERIEKAGIRLAGVLNEVFKSYSAKDALKRKPSQELSAETQDSTVDDVPLNELKAHIGKQLGTSGKVFGYKDFGSMVLLNVGATYPNQLLTVVLRGKAKAIAVKVDGKEITILGKVSLYKGKPQIEVSDPQDIVVH